MRLLLKSLLCVPVICAMPTASAASLNFIGRDANYGDPQAYATVNSNAQQPVILTGASAYSNILSVQGQSGGPVYPADARTVVHELFTSQDVLISSGLQVTLRGDGGGQLEAASAVAGLRESVCFTIDAPTPFRVSIVGDSSLSTASGTGHLSQGATWRLDNLQVTDNSWYTVNHATLPIVQGGSSIVATDLFAVDGTVTGMLQAGTYRIYQGHAQQNSGNTAANSYASLWTAFTIGGAAGIGDQQSTPILPQPEPNPERDDDLHFFGVPSGRWFDPPATSRIMFAMDGQSLFTDILSLPIDVDTDGMFEISSSGSVVGTFAAGERVDFVALLGHGVQEFTVSGIDPAVDTSSPTAFPIQLAFSTRTADFSMISVPEPSVLLPFTIFGSAVVNRCICRRPRTTGSAPQRM